MSKIARFAVLIATMASLFAIASSTASAVTWHNTGSTTFHATGGASSLSVGANNLACSGSTGSGTAPGGTFVNHYTITWTVIFSPCTLAGQNTYLHCHFTFLPTTTHFNGIDWLTGHLFWRCTGRLTATNTALCEVQGTTPAQYGNPSGAAPGKFTLATSSGLTVSHSSGTSCLLGTGTGHVSEQTMTLTSAGPILTRTA